MSGYNAASLYGRLGREPKRIETKTGTPMAVTSLAVTLPVSQSEETATQWFNLVAFGKTAKLLLKHDAGDLVGVMGSLSMNRWQRGEDTVEQLSVTAQAIMSARIARPSGGRKPERKDRQLSATQQDDRQADFEDEIPF